MMWHPDVAPNSVKPQSALAMSDNRYYVKRRWKALPGGSSVSSMVKVLVCYLITSTDPAGAHCCKPRSSVASFPFLCIASPTR
jgi:hypothetical protein